MLHRWRYECYSQNLIVRDCELNVCVHMRAFVHAYVCAFDRACVCCVCARPHLLQDIGKLAEDVDGLGLQGGNTGGGDGAQ